MDMKSVISSETACMLLKLLNDKADMCHSFYGPTCRIYRIFDYNSYEEKNIDIQI